MRITIRRVTLEFEDVELDVTPIPPEPTRMSKEFNGFPTLEEVNARVKARIAERFGHGPAHIEGSPSPK